MSVNEKEPILLYHAKSSQRPIAEGRLGRSRMIWLCVLTTLLVSIYNTCYFSDVRSGALIWKPCGEINRHQVECSRIDVPVDHFNNSSNATFSIPLTRLLGKNNTAIGAKHILLNPGGPGGSGGEFIFRRGDQLNRIVGEAFHLLSFDPRGVNGSQPRASCYTSSEQREQDIYNQPWHVESESSEMYVTAENRVKACSELMPDHGAWINTPQTAADMNTILDALGQEKMYYWGFSYGTTLGQTYAQLFPHRVSRMVIDGVSNLIDWYNTFYDEEDLIDTDKCYQEFIRHCFAAKENCALNRLKERVFKSSNDLAVYIDKFLHNLEQEALPVYLNASDYGSISRRSIVNNGIFPAMYRPAPMWPLLAKNLAALLDGNATLAYRAYSDSWVTSVIADETNTFVVHNDQWSAGENAPVHGARALKNFSLSAPQPSRLVSRYMAPDLFTRASWTIHKGHNFHPSYNPQNPFKTAEPILILSTTLDPVCPLVSAKKAHASFEGSGFIQQNSIGHCSISMPSLCTARHVQRYFHHGTLPASGTVCEIDGEYFPSASLESTKNQEPATDDMQLLTALKELAAIGITDTFKRRSGSMIK